MSYVHLQSALIHSSMSLPFQYDIQEQDKVKSTFYRMGVENQLIKKENFSDTISTKEHYQSEVKQNIVELFTKMVNHINSLYQSKEFITIPVYYINMDKHVNRKEFMEQELKKYTSSFTRIKGVNGSLITNLKKDTIEDVSFTCDYNDLTKGEIGCTLSHLVAIKKAYDNGDEYALVVEDDVQFNLLTIIDTSIKEIITQAPTDWEILKLCCIRNSINEPTVTYKNMKYHVENIVEYNTWGTQAYIINKKGMRKILGYTVINKSSPDFYIRKSQSDFPIKGAADWFLYQLTKTYNVSPCIIYPNNIAFNSTIHDDHTHLHIKQAYDIVNHHYSTSPLISLPPVL